MVEPLASSRGLVATDIRVALGKRAVLHGVDLQARHGEVVAILGPNGAGKSTLLRAACGLLPCAGSVQLDGHDVATMSARERARQIAFVPQHSALRSALPVRDVVLQGRFAHRGPLSTTREVDRQAVESALQKTDTARFAERAFTKLSFGEQRRVLLARGLASGAHTLCLDEPTAALDVGHTLRLHALLSELAKSGYAVVLVLHSLEDALKHTDRALLLDRGHVVCAGATADVIAEEHVRSVYGVEMRREGALGFSLPPA
jgi:iron complex transport system ATP-binding protein